MLIVVPARAGSKGVPGKNSRDFRGAPLVAWSFAAARVLGDRLNARVVCTTDDPIVAKIAGDFGVDIHDRPAQLASDTAGMTGVVIDVCQAFGADRYVLLQPTSPLRIRDDLDVLAAMVEKAPAVVSCTIPADAPEDIVELGRGPLIIGKTATRQERVAEYRFVDGAFYSGRLETLADGFGFMPDDAEYVTLSNPAAVDIDTPYDWAMAEAQHDWLVDKGVDFVRP